MSKTNKRRDCPALGRTISSRECGDGRGSKIACPADCPHFPFTPANYDRAGEIEDGLMAASFKRSMSLMSEAEQEREIRRLKRSLADDENGAMANHALFAWRCHVQRDKEGFTFGERWLADRKAGLSNDERVLLTAVNGIQPALLETQRFIDDQTTEVVDLLTGEPLRIVDRGLASKKIRYAVLLAWRFSMTHYDRMLGNAFVTPDIPNIDPEEEVREVIRHLGGPSDPAGERLWLSEHFVRVCDAISAVQAARWQDTLASVDARFTTTEYRSDAVPWIAERLVENEDVIEEAIEKEERDAGFARSFAWLESVSSPGSSQPKSAMDRKVIGRVVLGGDRVRVVAMTSGRHANLRRSFESLVGKKATFFNEVVEDMGAQMRAAQARPFDAALVPPRLREKTNQLSMETRRLPLDADAGAPVAQMLFDEKYADFAGKPIPWLDDKAPRAAAADPALRPKLVRLMKTHIRAADEHRREDGIDLDLNPLLAELGLSELISEPPPLRPGRDESEKDDDLDLLDGAGDLISAGTPISRSQIDARIAQMMERYPDVDNAIDAVDRCFPELLDFAHRTTERVVGESGWMILEVVIARACFELTPMKGTDYRLNLDRIAHRMPIEMREVLSAVKGAEGGVEQWVRKSPQPEVTDDLASVAVTLVEQLPKRDRPKDEHVMVIIAFLKALTQELHLAVVMKS